MTQKELLYVEDAIGHEENIISILNESISFLEDEDLVSFMGKELKKHESMRDMLMNKLEDACK